MKKLYTAGLILTSLFILSIETLAFDYDLKIVTYADFNYINYTASTINHAYFATTNGITRFNKLEKRWEEPLTATEGINHYDITRIWSDTFDRKLIAEASGGLFEYDFLFKRWYEITEMPDIDNENRHVGYPRELIMPFGYNYSGDGALLDEYNRYFDFTDQLQDQSGYTWIGTRGYGALQAETGSRQTQILPYGLIQNHVSCILNDNGMLWIGGYRRSSFRTGVSIFNPDENSFSYLETGVQMDLPSIDITCMTLIGEHLYLGSGEGLYIVNHKEESETVRHFNSRRGLIDDYVTCLDNNGEEVFVGTAYGMTVINEVKDSLRYFQLSEFVDQRLYDFEILNSDLWIASSGGLYRYKMETGKVQKFQDPKNRFFGHVYAVAGYDNYLWAVTNTVLMKLDTETADIKYYNVDLNLSDRVVLAVNDIIAVIGTDDGLNFTYYEEIPPYYKDLNIIDGLPSNYVNALLMDGDFLWIGSDYGLTRIQWSHPDFFDL